MVDHRYLINTVSYKGHFASKERHLSNASLAHGELNMILQKCERKDSCYIVLGSTSIDINNVLINLIFLLDDEICSITMDDIKLTALDYYLCSLYILEVDVGPLLLIRIYQSE